HRRRSERPVGLPVHPGRILQMKALALAISALALWAAALRAADDTGWNTYGGNYAGWRYSEFTQITTENVARLTPKWMFQTGIPGNMETTPLVRNGLMYLTAPSN